VYDGFKGDFFTDGTMAFIGPTGRQTNNVDSFFAMQIFWITKAGYAGKVHHDTIFNSIDDSYHAAIRVRNEESERPIFIEFV
jgi:hypothetical protein